VNPPVFRATPLEVIDDTITLSGREAHHAIAAQRTRVGEVIDVVDGRGLRVRATVTDISGPECLRGRVDSRHQESPPAPRVTAIQALIKDGELAVDQLTQAGVDRIIPWAAERSVVQWRPDRATKSQMKWQAAADQASKQSRRAWWPVVESVHTTADVLELLHGGPPTLLLDASSDRYVTEQVPGVDFGIIIGPEGDVTPQEAEAFRAAGAIPVHLGPQVWRSTAAGMAALTLARAAVSGRMH